MKFEGSLVALITPMTQDGSVDYSALTRLLDYHVEAGTHGIVAVGTTGESSTLMVDEHLAVIEHTIKVCLLYTSPSPRDKRQSRMPSSA